MKQHFAIQKVKFEWLSLDHTVPGQLCLSPKLSQDEIRMQVLLFFGQGVLK